jgi:Fe-Mn family superoxide dismutase
MKTFEEKKFDIPKLKGISEKTIEEHLKLYAGYVKNANLIQSMLEMYGKTDAEDGKYSVSEIRRRFAFEFGGMRNHEVYFSQFEGGPQPLGESSELAKVDWNNFKTMALTRGVGWAMLGYDKKSGQLIQYWVDEQHLGHLPEVAIVLALDMWEHSFVADYQPSGKKQYIEDFFENLNWQKVEENLAKAQA